MTLKRYHQIRIVIVISLAIAVSNSIVVRNYPLAVTLIAVASLVLMHLRGKVQGVIADERDRALMGTSALIAMRVYAWLALAAVFVFLALGETSATFDKTANVLAFSTCALMLIYSIVFSFLTKAK